MSSQARIAAAPISWGVCEVPGWGPMLPADRVLREVRSLGLDAIELGAPGFLPTDAPSIRSVLDDHGVRLIGGFVPVVLHDESARTETLRAADVTAALLAEAGSEVFVSAVVTDLEWAPRRPLSDGEWKHLLAMLGELDTLCAAHGLRQVIHPHVGTLVESAADVEFVLTESEVSWTFDTGHLAIGGYDPVEFARRYPERIGHVHLKDVDAKLAARLRGGEISLMDATLAGLFKVLGRGDVDVAAAIRAVLDSGYDGWFVLEQDTSINGDVPAEGSGPVEDVRTSLEFLRAQIAEYEKAS